MDTKLLAIYKLYFEWDIAPKDVYYFCNWWAWVDSVSDCNKDSIITITNKILLDLKTPKDLTIISGKEVIKFMRKYQFASFPGRIKNVLRGVLIIVLRIIGVV